MHIAILAGEASGDQLGAELMKALRSLHLDIQFDGIGGPLMQEQGFESLLPIENFSVMGITEILKSLPQLLFYRRKLTKFYQKKRPDAFIGIDYPEFNLSLENRLKAAGIYTVQYVSPSVWAWREERIHHIKASCDLMLTLFDFEKQFYDQHAMPAVHCGHPLVDIIATNSDVLSAREALGLDIETSTDIKVSDGMKKCLAVLPGSRVSEVSNMLPIYIEVMRKLTSRIPAMTYLIPAATPALKLHIEQLLRSLADNLNVRVFVGQARTVMQAADSVLLTSGTATLEAMLLEKPMLVSYKLSGLTARLAKKRLKISHFSLPNLLANASVVPEFMQDDIDEVAMAEEIYRQITDIDYRAHMIEQLRSLRCTIKTHAADNAAKALYEDMKSRDLVK